MNTESAIKILECMSVDMVGCLAGLKESDPLTDVINQRLKAIDIAQDALRQQDVRDAIINSDENNPVILSEDHRKIVLAMAENSMSITEVANALGYHRNTIAYHVQSIYKKYGLDPRNFFHLLKLVRIAKGEVR